MVTVQSHTEPMAVPPVLIERAATATLEHQRTGGNLTVLLSDDGHLRELNRNYLGIDATTDVLSFPSAERDPETDEAYLGDVIISVPQAQVQARAAGHPLESEMQLLIVHGVLHLLGHDHGDRASRRRMWDAQADVLRSLGLAGLKIPE